MNKRLPHRAIHQQMQQEISQFFEQGGEVHEFERGESALINGKLDDRSSGFGQGRKKRTPLNDELKAVDERKKSPAPPVVQKVRRPYKKIIYDDFGEPIREVWVE